MRKQESSKIIEAISILRHRDLNIDEQREKILLINNSLDAGRVLNGGRIFPELQPQLVNKIDHFVDATEALVGGKIARDLQPQLIEWIWNPNAASWALRYGNIAVENQKDLSEWIEKTRDALFALLGNSLTTDVKESLKAKLSLPVLAEIFNNIYDDEISFMDTQTDSKNYEDDLPFCNMLKHCLAEFLLQENDNDKLCDRLDKLASYDIEEEHLEELCGEENSAIFKQWQIEYCAKKHAKLMEKIKKTENGQTHGGGFISGK